MTYLLSILIPCLFFLALDLYAFQAIRGMTASLGTSLSTIIRFTYWFLSIISIVYLPVYRYWGYAHFSKEIKLLLTGFLFAVFAFKFILILFLLTEDLVRLFRFVYTRVRFPEHATAISRSAFLSQVAGISALIPAVSLVYGIVRNRYNYRIHQVDLSFPHLPEAFDQFTIVQLSDIHAGSFSEKSPLYGAVSQVNNLQPDMILFTGDLVNNLASEMDDYMDVFGGLRAKHGIYSVLGNHDYGDYIPWNSMEDKKDNFRKILEVHRKLGWNLLRNEHHYIQRGADKMALVGVENWGKGRFAKYGNLDVARGGVASDHFKILLSHDPSHWSEKVLTGHPDIDLTLSGHTHGFQFGIESRWLKWSPSRFVYPHWAGLYRAGKQFLYVNRGFGFLGYPGRLGILPEITFIRLRRGNLTNVG